MKVVLASHNQKKMVEMKAILSQMGVEVLSQAEVGVDLEPEETGTTFEENARIKAQAVMQATCLPSPTTPASWWTPWGATLGSTPPGTAARGWTTRAGGSSC